MPSSALIAYLQDHLAGSKFAVGLLGDLERAGLDGDLRSEAAALLDEITADRERLEQLIPNSGSLPEQTKESAAWLLQKAARLKLAPQEALGAFEAIEVLCLGIQGKIGLWRVLIDVPQSTLAITRPELERLVERGDNQHARAQRLRLALARLAFGEHSTQEK